VLSTMWLRIVESFALCPKPHQMQGPLHRTETSQMHQPAMKQARQMPGRLHRHRRWQRHRRQRWHRRRSRRCCRLPAAGLPAPAPVPPSVPKVAAAAASPAVQPAAGCTRRASYRTQTRRLQIRKSDGKRGGLYGTEGGACALADSIPLEPKSSKKRRQSARRAAHSQHRSETCSSIGSFGA
jgi:hypothetical protein